MSFCFGSFGFTSLPYPLAALRILSHADSLFSDILKSSQEKNTAVSWKREQCTSTILRSILPKNTIHYEIVAGHRRKHACELAGLATMPFTVREMDDDTATILMRDSNLQRENILPSERAFAYKMKLETINRQAESLCVPPI